MGSGQVCQIIT
ncbi:hypothetical protein VULLAG_LOCUS11869 [Vulpes lagopus]